MEFEKHLTLWDLVDSALSVPPGQRSESAVQQLLPWFHERSAVFKQLDDEKLAGVIQSVKLQKFRNDFVLVHQGAIGHCFYIIVKGTVALHAKRDDELEGQEPVAKEIFTAKGPKDRARFGPELCTLGPGRSFGELCVISENKVRNATVITDEAVTFVVVDEAVYSKYVSEEFGKKLLMKSGFVNSHVLFKGWPTAYRNLLIESLQERIVKFGETVVKQGDPFETIGFVMKGQANVCIDVERHWRQFEPMLRKRNSEGECSDKVGATLNTIGRRIEKRDVGFFASELRHRPNVCVALIGAQGIVGDVEAIMDLKTHSASIECVQEMTLFEMDLVSFIRIIVKKTPETFEQIRKTVLLKMKYRTESIKGGIPIYDQLLKVGDSVGKDEAKKILAEALRKRKKKRAAMAEQKYEATSRSGSLVPNAGSRRSSRANKMKMNINPATGEVTIESNAAMSDEDRRKASEDWEQSRRRFSISRSGDRKGAEKSSEAERGNLKPIAEEEEDGTDNIDTSGKERGLKVDWKGANAMIVNAVRMSGQRTDRPIEEKRTTLQEYKELRRKMQTMGKTTHRVSWTG